MSFGEQLKEEFDRMAAQDKVIKRLEDRTGIKIKDGDSIYKASLQTAVISMFLEFMELLEKMDAGGGDG